MLEHAPGVCHTCDLHAFMHMRCAGNHEIEQQSVVTKFFASYTARLKNAHAASNSPSFHFYSVSSPQASVACALVACMHART